MLKCTDRHKSASIRQATNGNTQVWRCSVVLGVHSCVSCELSGTLKLFFETGVSNIIASPPGEEPVAGCWGLLSLPQSSSSSLSPAGRVMRRPPLFPAGPLGLAKACLCACCLGCTSSYRQSEVSSSPSSISSWNIKEPQCQDQRTGTVLTALIWGISNSLLLIIPEKWQENYQNSFGGQPSYLCRI